MSGNNIKVVCRFRPQNKLEIREGGVPIIDIDEDGTQVTLKVKKKKKHNLITMFIKFISLF
jgi:kinesin family protein 5